MWSCHLVHCSKDCVKPSISMILLGGYGSKNLPTRISVPFNFHSRLLQSHAADKTRLLHQARLYTKTSSGECDEQMFYEEFTGTTLRFFDSQKNTIAFDLRSRLMSVTKVEKTSLAPFSNEAEIFRALQGFECSCLADV